MVSVRGVGLVSGLAVAITGGLADGAITYARAPTTSLSTSLLGWSLFHCSGVVVAMGLLLGTVQELLLQAAARRRCLRATARYLLSGPARWFAADAPLARRVFAGALAAVTAVTWLIVAAMRIATVVRSPLFTAVAVVVAAAMAVAAGGAVAILVAWAVDGVLPRIARWASPAAGAAAAALLAAPLIAAFGRHHAEALWTVCRAEPAVLVGALAIVLDASLVILLLRLRARSPCALAVRWCVAAGVSALALMVASALTVGRQQLVVSTLLARSVVARHLIGPLQRSTDGDGDGHGVWFGGGDCDDRDATIHPSAVEVPGNGIDENCSGEDAPPPPLVVPPTDLVHPPRRSSVLFFSVDAARPDHLSAYGYSRPTTPNLSRFGERAARFLHAYSTSPQSIPSLAAVFTGRYASTLAWGAEGPFRALEPNNTTVAEVFRAEGYATAAFLNTSYFSLTNGFFQGFELVAEGPLFKDDEVTAVRRAAGWLDERRRREEPFFAWIHIINPHAPYQDHSEPQDFGHTDIDRYDEEIARADAAFGAVLAATDMLERDGQPVLVVVLADHGEAFGEHGRFHHAQDLHDEAIRVPLIIRGPGVVAGERRALASLLDLQATALWFAGLPQVPGTASRSLATVLLTPDRCAASATCVRESLGAEIHPQHDCTSSVRALVAPPWKVIYDVHHNAWELYNLAADPRELHNVFDAYPARAAAMRARLLDTVESRQAAAGSAAANLATTERREP